MKARSISWSLVVMVLSAAASFAGAHDAWITTKAKLSLLTTDGVSVTGVNVDTVDGNVTLHGKVKTDAEKQKAEAAVKGIDGVKNVKNLLQVVPEAFKEQVKEADDAIKGKVQTSLKSDASLEDVKVASVNDGVVLLSGKTKTLDQKLKAVEAAWTVSGVRRVSTEIETNDK
jgi:hyperosmotically inducible protein